MILDKIAERPLASILILSILCGYLFFFDLGALALTDPDESFYAQTAKEMSLRNEWSTPYLYDKPQFEKPIMFYWLVEAAFKVFGANEFSARLPSAVFGLIGIIALYLLGSLIFNRRAGLISALVLATCVEYIILSRACVTDMVLGTFMLLGVLFFFQGRIKKKGYYYILSSIAFAFATLTKGPVFVVLPLAAIFIYVVSSKDWIVFRPRMHIMLSILIFFAVAVPWYIIMYRLHGNDFIDVFFGFHNVTRFLESEHRMGSQWYYNIPIIAGGFFPWSVFLPIGFWRMFRKCAGSAEVNQDIKRHSIFILSWFFVIFLFFSFSSTKLPTYVFPSFISLALIVGVLWDDFFKDTKNKEIAVWIKTSYYLLLAIIIFGSVGVAIFVSHRYPPILKGAIISAVFLIIGTVLSFIGLIRKKFTSAFFLLIFSVMFFLYPFGKLALPELEPYETSKAIAKKLISFIKPGERVGAENYYLPGVAFYTDTIPVDIDKHDKLVKFVQLPERVWFVIKEKNHVQLYTLQTKPYCMKSSYMVYKLGKRALATNMVPEDGRYLIKRERSDFEE